MKLNSAYLLTVYLLLILTISLCAQDIKRIAEIPLYDNSKIHKNVAVIIYNPVIESKGNKTITQLYNWNNPDDLIDQYIKDVRESSWDIVEYKVAEKIVVDEFPLHLDGFRYTDETFMEAWAARKFHDAGGDYKKIIEDFNLADKVEKRLIDEVWLFGAPGFSWWESTMAGKDSYFCNSDPVQEVDCSRRFILMGFNYERGVDCMLEDLGHRTESIMWHIYGNWEANENTPWNKFTLYDKNAPGKAQVGNIHFAPNSVKDYEWGSRKYVESFCDDWYTYPILPGKKRSVNSEEWGNGDMRKHHIWWFKHLPRATGAADGKLNNWWRYVMNYDEY
ncbi:MAG: hypothetical protein WC061_05150 [Melioribacteraceae bacterium]